MTPEATNLCRRYADVLRASGRSDRTIDNYLNDTILWYKPTNAGFVGFVKNLAAAAITQCVEAARASPQGGRAQATVRVALEHSVEEVACAAVLRQQVVDIVEVLAGFGDDAGGVVVKGFVLVPGDEDVVTEGVVGGHGVLLFLSEQ